MSVWCLVNSKTDEVLESFSSRAEADATLDRIRVDDPELAGRLRVQVCEIAPSGGAQSHGLSWDRLFGWLSQHLLVALTLLGLLAYGVIQYGYVQFYGRFGVDPEEVGLDYAHTLSQSVPSLAVVVFIWTLAACVALLVLRGAAYLWRKYGTPLWRKYGKQPQPTKRAKQAEPQADATKESAWDWRSVLVILVASGVVAAAVNVHRTLEGLADKVEAGEAIHSAPIEDRGDIVIHNPLALSAEPVHIRRVGATSMPIGGLRHRLMYLGGSNGTDVFYDPDCRRVVRLRTGNIVIVQLDPDVEGEGHEESVVCEDLVGPGGSPSG